MVTKQQLQSMDPYEFEELVADLWKSKGYTTNVRKKSGDRGVDIEAERGGRKEVIQVKRYSNDNKIGSEEVRKYATLYQQTDSNQVVLVTSGDVTNQARNLAPDLGVEIVDGAQLVQELQSNNISSRQDSGSVQEKQSGQTSQSSVNFGSLLASIFAWGVVIVIILTFFGAFAGMIEWGADPLISFLQLEQEVADTYISIGFLSIVGITVLIAIAQEMGLDNKTGNILLVSIFVLVTVPLISGRLIEDFVGPVGQEGMIGSITILVTLVLILYFVASSITGTENKIPDEDASEAD